MVDLYNVTRKVNEMVENFEQRLRSLAEEYSCPATTARRKRDILREQKWVCDNIDTLVTIHDRIDIVIDRNRDLFEQ